MTPEKLGGSSPTDGSWPELAVLALVTRGHSGPGTLRLAGVAPWGPWPAQTPISPVPRAASATIRTPCDMPGGDPHCPRTARALKCGFRTSPLPQAPSKRLSPHEGGGLAHTPLSPHPALTSSSDGGKIRYFSHRKGSSSIKTRLCQMFPLMGKKL